jgi:hypothetical protein
MELAQIIDGHLVIKLDLKTLCFAAVRGPYFENEECKEPKVTDEKVFAEAIVHELNAEAEDGTTLVHRMLDQAAENAVEQGAEGIELPAPSAEYREMLDASDLRGA